jgi:hexosaminidase
MTQLNAIPSSPSASTTIPPPTRTVFPKLRVVPLPTSFTVGFTPIIISPNLTINLVTSGGVAISPPFDLGEAIERTKGHIFQTRHQYLSPTRGSEFFDTVPAATSVPVLTNISLQLKSHDLDTPSLTIAQCAHAAVEDRSELETYRLTISDGAHCLISSNSTLGLLRGLTTFEQLIYHLPLGHGDKAETGESGLGKLYAPHAPYEIKDRPAFGWRGILLDTSRNWFSLQAIRKVCLICSYLVALAYLIATGHDELRQVECVPLVGQSLVPYHYR